MLPKIKGDRRARFEQVLRETPVLFDYHGLERGGHFAVLNWLKSVGPKPAYTILSADSARPRLVYPSNWFGSFKDPPQTAAVLYAPDYDISLGRSRTGSKAVFICVRDIRNMLASRMKWNANNPFGSIKLDSSSVHIWQLFARQALGDVDYFNGNCIPIVYDKWFIDRTYRESIVDAANTRFGWELSLADEEEVLSTVANAGGGSSFDKMEFQGRAQDMKVLERWKCAEGSPLIEKLLTDEVLALNRRLLEV